MPAFSDSSPLILFARIGRLEWLREIFGEIVIPPAVEAEVVAEALGRPGAHEIATARWVRIAKLHRHPGAYSVPARLGAGEAEVIALALEFDGPRLVIMDDGDGRRVAREHGLDVVGSAGVLVLAKEAGLIPIVRPALDGLMAAGLFLGDQAYRAVLGQAAET